MFKFKVYSELHEKSIFVEVTIEELKSSEAVQNLVEKTQTYKVNS